jgi:hypothetical protein
MIVAIALLGSGWLRVCDSSDEAPSGSASASAEARLNANANASVKPQIGGRVVAVGDHSVELLVHERGIAEALVFDAKGALLPDPASANLKVTAAAKAGGRQEIAALWSPPRARFVGSAKGKAELAPGPVDVELTINGKPAKATLEAQALVTGPRLGGALIVAGDYSAEVLAKANGEVEALVYTASLAEVDGKANLGVNANLKGAAGGQHKVALKWDGPRARFVGKADAALAAGPAELNIDANGKAHAGAVAKLGLQAAAQHGGKVVVAGDYSVELVAGPGDVVVAYVFDANGKAMAGADVDLTLEVSGRPIRFAWHAPSASFRAALNADANIAVEPIRVSVVAGGKAFVGGSLGLKAVADADAPSQRQARPQGEREGEPEHPSAENQRERAQGRGEKERQRECRRDRQGRSQRGRERQDE